MVEVTTAATAPKATITLLRTLAKHLAEQTEGAAFDPRQDGLIWPRGRRTTTVPAGERNTSMLTLDWFVAPSRWERAAEQIVGLLARRCPEALPTRYGQWEPPPHRFDRGSPETFTRAILDDGDVFWYATRPSFGGPADGPAADQEIPVGRISLDFDGGLVRADDRWREALVDLFATAARSFDAFFASAQETPGYLVSRNQPWSTTESSINAAEHILRRRSWQGLPPVPMWLSCKAASYADLVAPGLVRLSEEVRPRAALPAVAPPAELTYRHRPSVVRADGSVATDPARPEDRARRIPDLS